MPGSGYFRCTLQSPAWSPWMTFPDSASHSQPLWPGTIDVPREQPLHAFTNWPIITPCPFWSWPGIRTIRLSYTDSPLPRPQSEQHYSVQESKRETSKILHIILLNTVLSPPRDQNPGRRQLEATLLFLMTLSPRIHGNSGRVRTPYNINNPNLAGLNLRRPSLVF